VLGVPECGDVECVVGVAVGDGLGELVTDGVGDTDDVLAGAAGEVRAVDGVRVCVGVGRALVRTCVAAGRGCGSFRWTALSGRIAK
jgi:hypothetical protein